MPAARPAVTRTPRMMRRALAGPPCLRPRRNLSRRADMDDRAKLRRRHRWRATSDCSCAPLSCPRVGGLPCSRAVRRARARAAPRRAARAGSPPAARPRAGRGRGPLRPSPRRRRGRGPPASISASRTVPPSPIAPASSSHAAVGVDVRRQPERHLRDDARRDDRVVADDDRRETLVRHDEAGVVGRAQPRVGEPHVLDGARDVLDRHEVADPDRLGDRRAGRRPRRWRASAAPRSR